MKAFFSLIFLMSCIETTSEKAIGIWEVPPEKQRLEGDNWIAHPHPHIFSYDGEYVTLFLFTEKEWMWKTEDDYYKLKTEWQDDSLFYQPPFGVMTYLATFKEGKFQKSQQLPEREHIWVYEKITEVEVSEADKALIVERKIHDYSTRPMDKREYEEN